MVAHSSGDKFIVIVGQTASGKSALALELAEKLGGEIICADSRTIYKGMDIGTAKPPMEDQAKVPHHLLDILTPDQSFTAADFKKRAEAAIADISKRKKVPIMVGGTGLYIDAVLFDYSFAKPGAERDPDNPRHAHTSAGGTKEELRPNTLVLAIEADPGKLKQRIKDRVQGMIDGGLREEANNLVNIYGWDVPGLNTIGYKEWQPLFRGKVLKEAEIISEIIRNTTDYAKRQKTWFKRNKSIQWLEGSFEHFDSAEPAGPDRSRAAFARRHISDIPSHKKQPNNSQSATNSPVNKSTQKVPDPSKGVDIATTFLYKN